MPTIRTLSVLVATAGCLTGFAVAAGPASATTAPWADGTAFVASQGLRFGSGAAYAITPTGGEIYLGGGSAEDIAVASDGTVYWVTCSGYVDKYVPGTGASTVAALPSCGTSIAVEPSGKLLVGDFSNLYEMNTDGSGVTTLESGQVFSSLAVDAAGDIYAVDGGQDLEVRPAGSTSFTRTSGLPLDGQLRSVRLAADNSLLVGTTSGAADIPLSGGAPTQYTTGDYSEGATVDQGGDIWISDEKDSPSTGDQVDYLPAGGSLSVLATGFDDPRGLAVYPVVTQPTRSASTVTVTRGAVNKQREALLTATVDGGAATSGYVQFSIDGDALNDVATVGADGQATTKAFLIKGTHDITATYLGSSTENASESAPLPYTLTALHSEMFVGADSLTVPQDQPVQVTATVIGRSGGPAPTGDVSFYVNGHYATSVELDSNEHAIASLNLPPGTPTVRATYGGDNSYAGISGTLQFTTTAPYDSSTSTGLHLGGILPSGKQHVTIPVTVKGVSGQPRPTGSVTADNGFVCSALVPATNPRAATSTCHANLPQGNFYDVTISYLGDANYGGSDSSQQFFTEGGG